MRFVETPIAGAFIVEAEPVSDERGFFARVWCVDELRDAGLRNEVVQVSVSLNVRAGTLRGMHWQRAPHAETKVVRCTRGAIFDVIVDVRPSSLSYRRWYGIELSEDYVRMLYIPEGVAHGFLTLTDDTEVLYQMSDSYVPTATRGVRWDDPAFAIEWPAPPLVMSERDRAFPDFDE